MPLQTPTRPAEWFIGEAAQIAAVLRNEQDDTDARGCEFGAILTGTARAACEAVETMFHSIGASVVRKGERLQRYFRDVQMYRVHFQSQAFSPVLRARVQLGLPPPLPFHR